MSISLEKKVDLVKAVLAKRSVPDNVSLQVKAAIDISGSMQPMFANGTVQELIDRLLAVAVRFDDNQSIEAYAFGSGALRLRDIQPDMFGSYVSRVFLPEAQQSRFMWSGTQYASALSMILRDVKPGLFGFGRKVKPSYLMFVTDGDTSDERETEELLKKLGEQNVYVQLIGIATGSRFAFLKRMGDKYDHVGFVTLPNLATMTDEQLYEALLSEELATWIQSR